MLMVEVILYATLAVYVPGAKAGSPVRMEVEEGETVLQLLCRLKVPPEKVKLVFVNGIQRETGYILQNNDRVGIFPPIAGG